MYGSKISTQQFANWFYETVVPKNIYPLHQQTTSVTKDGMAHVYQAFLCKCIRFQVSVQINEVLAIVQYKVNKLEIKKILKGSRDHNKM